MSRGQAQNAADAGALAGAVARAWDDKDDPPVLAASPRRRPCSWPPANQRVGHGGRRECHVDVSDRRDRHSASRVDVYRNGEFGSAICRSSSPRCSASASRACAPRRRPSCSSATRANCMRPFSVPGQVDRDDFAPRTSTTTGTTSGATARRRAAIRTTSTAARERLGRRRHGRLQRYRHAVHPEDRQQPEQRQRSTSSPGGRFPVRLPDGEGGYFSGASDYRGRHRRLHRRSGDHRRSAAARDRRHERSDQPGRGRPRSPIRPGSATFVTTPTPHIDGTAARRRADPYQPADRADQRLRRRGVPARPGATATGVAAADGGKCVKVVQDPRLLRRGHERRRRRRVPDDAAGRA